MPVGAAARGALASLGRGPIALGWAVLVMLVLMLSTLWVCGVVPLPEPGLHRSARWVWGVTGPAQTEPPLHSHRKRDDGGQQPSATITTPQHGHAAAVMPSSNETGSPEPPAVPGTNASLLQALMVPTASNLQDETDSPDPDLQLSSTSPAPSTSTHLHRVLVVPTTSNLQDETDSPDPDLQLSSTAPAPSTSTHLHRVLVVPTTSNLQDETDSPDPDLRLSSTAPAPSTSTHLHRVLVVPTTSNLQDETDSPDPDLRLSSTSPAPSTSTHLHRVLVVPTTSNLQDETDSPDPDLQLSSTAPAPSTSTHLHRVLVVPTTSNLQDETDSPDPDLRLSSTSPAPPGTNASLLRALMMPTAEPQDETDPPDPDVLPAEPSTQRAPQKGVTTIPSWPTPPSKEGKVASSTNSSSTTPSVLGATSTGYKEVKKTGATPAPTHSAPWDGDPQGTTAPVPWDLDRVMGKCLLAILLLALVAATFMVCTGVLGALLWRRSRTARRQLSPTEMICISSLLPEGEVPTNGPKPRPARRHRPLLDGGFEADGDSLTLSSFLPEHS